MLRKDEFVDMLTGSYRNLYDLVRLRTDPLGPLIFADPTLGQKERAWKLHRLLLDMIDELKPGPQAPPASREMRRYRLMHLRYVEAFDPQTVASQLAITRRHFYREHGEALEALANILWDRYLDAMNRAPGDTTTNINEHTAMTGRETHRPASTQEVTSLPVIINDVINLVQPLLCQRGTHVVAELAEELPSALVHRGMLRQVLLGLFGFIAEHVGPGTITVSVHDQSDSTLITVDVVGQLDDLYAFAQPQLHELNAVAALSGITVLLNEKASELHGFSVRITPATSRSILVVDDNEDMLLLYQSYLSPHSYHVIVASNAATALEYALDTAVDCILLDLMMPDQDGWDMLQRLRNQAHTQHIPIVICSVLKQKNLALSLGAAAFIEKPITETSLLATLEQLGM